MEGSAVISVPISFLLIVYWFFHFGIELICELCCLIVLQNHVCYSRLVCLLEAMIGNIVDNVTLKYPSEFKEYNINELKYQNGRTNKRVSKKEITC